jgi:hypothetical protein
MFYYIYQITNLVNNKIYVGVHKTTDMDDGYMGSGKIIKAAIKKYGIDNFRKDILEMFDDSDSMYAREKELVTDEFLLREDTYNLRRGGTGGFDFINKNALNHNATPTGCSKGGHNRYITHRALLIEQARQNALKRWSENSAEMESYRQIAVNASLQPESRMKRIETMKLAGHQQGNKNSQYGTCWIWHDLIGNRKCQKELLPLYIDQGWNKGRKINTVNVVNVSPLGV